MVSGMNGTSLFVKLHGVGVVRLLARFHLKTRRFLSAFARRFEAAGPVSHLVMRDRVEHRLHQSFPGSRKRVLRAWLSVNSRPPLHPDGTTIAGVDVKFKSFFGAETAFIEEPLPPPE